MYNLMNWYKAKIIVITTLLRRQTLASPRCASGALPACRAPEEKMRPHFLTVLTSFFFL